MEVHLHSFLTKKNKQMDVQLHSFLTKKTSMDKRIGRVDEQLYSFLLSALEGGKWSLSRPGQFNVRENTPCIL